MARVVQKFGGSSVSDAEALRRVARRIAATKKAGHEVVVVVSAMGDTTDDLLDLAAQVMPDDPPARELDILLTAGERISMSLLAMALTGEGVRARSYTGQQAGLVTDINYGRASIVKMAPERILQTLQDDQVAIVAGFQGVNERNDVTTLGRGGSDTTAVALAASLDADVCEIFSDVDGLFTADPRIVPKARKIERISFEETLELASHGAKILHLRAVEFARRYGVPLHVRSSFSNLEGTLVTSEDTYEGADMEEPIISGIAHDESQSKITVVDVPDIPGSASRLFRVVAAAEANIDMIVQNVSAKATGTTDISFTLPTTQVAAARRALEAAREEIGYGELRADEEVGLLSLVGAGMRSNPGVSARLFDALYNAGINIEMISTSEIRISVVTRGEDLTAAVRAVHTAFDLDAQDTEAVVYGGTGR
ncbi:aspartate kinase [Georgenia sp. Z1491]|uniref:aspartate kinase n=1 Tax=Georgenia sp. Z1491 TaxID=3416707 RepID=UPI003CEC16EA